MVEYGAIHGIPNPPTQSPPQLFCEECKSGWFVRHRVTQLQDYQVLMGQEGLELDPIFFLYECIACGLMTAPPTSYTGFSNEQKIYEELLRIIDVANKRKGCKCPG